MKKTFYLVQVLLHDREDLLNYAYYASKSDADSAVKLLLSDNILHVDFARVKEIFIRL